MEKIHILNCDIAKVTKSEVVTIVDNYVKTRKFHLGCGINADQVVKMNENQEFNEIIHRADIVFADGMSLIVASKFLRMPLPERIGAIDLFEELLHLAVKKQYKIFLLGTKEEILIKAVDYYSSKYPSLNISGYNNGYWSSDDEEILIDKINKSSPDFLFLGISSPKKEYFIENHRDKLKTVSFALGVGGTFDIDAGVYTRAPIWMQKFCLEWFWRLLQEPKRMFWRYTINNIKFIKILLRDLFKSASKPVNNT